MFNIRSYFKSMLIPQQTNGFALKFESRNGNEKWKHKE